MMRRGFRDFGVLGLMVGVLVAASGVAYGEVTPAASAGFDRYVGGVEARLAEQHRAGEGFLAGGVLSAPSAARLRGGELIVEQVTPAGGTELPGALLHHWRGTAFVPGATAAEFERMMKDFGGYPQRFSPQVVQAKVLAAHGDRVQAVMRVRQKHVITVVMDTAYDITYGRPDAGHGYSASRSTKISEIASAGTGAERVLGANEEHGFLWRMNTYWSYEERDGGLYMQVESVSLSRSIPHGLGWAVGPFVESVPRESMEFTLRASRDGLTRGGLNVVTAVAMDKEGRGR